LGELTSAASTMTAGPPSPPQGAMAVLDLDLLQLPPRLEEADRFAGALVLLRIGGRPCGQALLSFTQAFHQEPLLETLMTAADSAFWEAWLEHVLGLPPSPPELPDLTCVDVVICTRDRPEELRKCLTDLLAMPQEGQRHVVVDNASSSDETRRVVEAFPDVLYVREDRPGLDIARNTGIRACDRDLIAFIDDDAAPDRQWLRKLCRNFADPSVMAVGGLTMAMELATRAQVEFERMGGFSRGFKRMVYDQSNCDPLNMALRRGLVDIIGWFDEALDAGTKSLAGGDADYFRRIMQAGWRIAYDPEALNWHRHRRTMAELEQQLFGYEVSALAIITKALFFERDIRAVGALVRWFRMRARQLRGLLRPHSSRLPFTPLAVQLKGALAGPSRYCAARRACRAPTVPRSRLGR
jgi:GT2 family glycosyltransferase